MFLVDAVRLPASVALRISRRDSAEKKFGPRLENWNTALRRTRPDVSAVVVFAHVFSSFSKQNLNLLSAVLARWKFKVLRATKTGSYELSFNRLTSVWHVSYRPPLENMPTKLVVLITIGRDPLMVSQEIQKIFGKFI